jgi:2-amino-4-hydroxy-6-hydroxymethyldihydropteridine diphosphokinase
VAGDVTTDFAWLALGANIGSRGAALARLRAALEQQGLHIEQASAEVLTRAVGVTNQEDFHNQVIRARAPAPWAPPQWLDHCQAAERAAGRKTTFRWGPRVADVDILLLGRRGDITVRTERLIVPHPQLPNRPFLSSLLAQAGFSASAG